MIFYRNILLETVSSLCLVTIPFISAANSAFVLPTGARQSRVCGLPRAYSSSPIATRDIRIGELLSDLPTPCLILELSLAERSLKENKCTSSLDDILADIANVESTSLLDGTLFVHTKVTSTAKRDTNDKNLGSGAGTEICEVDISPRQIPGGAYLGIGLANHHVGGYYWARGMGIGASLPAHGIAFGHQGSQSSNDMDELGELYWKKRGPGQDPNETTEESSNSNDGKRSEWADFVSVGDTVQLVPDFPLQVLANSTFCSLVGMRRIGRPLGADPIVEKVWTRSSGSNGWVSG